MKYITLDENGMHINFSALEGGKEADLSRITAGILEHIGEMTLLLNPEPASYRRLGRCMAPGYITWGRENRSALIRIPAASPKYRRGELRSPDPMANPYLAYGLMIGAGLEGLEQGLALPGDNQASIRMVHNTVSTFHPVVLTANGILLQQLEVAGAIVIVLEALDGILLVLRVLGIVQRGPRARMGHDIAYLLNPNTLCRVIGRFCNDRRAYSTGAHQCDHRYVCHCHLFHSLILLLLKAFQAFTPQL